MIKNIDRNQPGLIWNKLCCPVTHTRLFWNETRVFSENNQYAYDITSSGIPLFADKIFSSDAARQREHYDQNFVSQYIENLNYPHTQVYMSYLDKVFLKSVEPIDLTEVAEICCGQGEVLAVFEELVKQGIGVDISPAMLEKARLKYNSTENFIFVQGDATMLPIESNSFQCVIMLGGVHHVSDREKLFSEIFRILKPGGRFYFREPVSDFILWRLIRSVIYKISPALDADTERPLIWKETVPVLENVGFNLKSWKTYGFFGFCLFMNSDVLVFNRVFRFIPGIRLITRLATKLDGIIVKIPGLRRAGLQVVGVAEKPL